MFVVPSVVRGSIGATGRAVVSGVLRPMTPRRTGAKRARVSCVFSKTGRPTLNAGRSGAGNRFASAANDRVRFGGAGSE
jgi:hypothetical protein